MRGSRALLWASFALILFLSSIFNIVSGESAVSKPKAASIGRPAAKASKRLVQKKEPEEDEEERLAASAKSTEGEEGEEAEAAEEEGEDEEEDDEEDDERISFMDSTRIKTEKDLRGNDFFTRVLLATRKRVVNSSPFRFIAEGKSFEAVSGMLAWRLAFALGKDPAMARKARLLFTLYLAMYLGYLLYVRHAALHNNDTRLVKVEAGASALTAVRGLLKKFKASGMSGVPEGAADLLKPQTVEMTFRKYDLMQVKAAFRRFTTWMGLMTYMHFRMKNVSFILYWGMLGPLVLLREPLFQLYVLGMDETGMRERPFGPKEEPEQVEEEGEADGSTEAAAASGDEEASAEEGEEEKEVVVEEEEEEEEEEAAPEEEEEEEEAANEEEDEAEAKEEGDEEERGQEKEGQEEEEEETDDDPPAEEEEEDHQEEEAGDSGDGGESDGEKEEGTMSERGPGRHEHGGEGEEEPEENAAVAEDPAHARHGDERPEGFHVQSQYEDTHPHEPTDAEKAMTPDTFHVEKQRKDVKPDDAPPVDAPGKVVVDKQKADAPPSTPPSTPAAPATTGSTAP